MSFPFRKILVIGSAVFFSLLLLLGIWYFGGRSRVDVYSSENLNNPDALETKFNNQPKETLNDWEKQILDRNSYTPSNEGDYTNNVARGVLEEYFRAKQANTEVNEEKLVENTLSQVLPQNYNISYKEYKISDLKISTDNSVQSFKNYGNKFGEVSSKNVYDTTWGNEFEILTRGIQLNRESEFARLNPIIKNYENLILDFLKIETPSEITSTHLNILNSLSQILSSVKEFHIIMTDPFRGIFVMTSYANYTANLHDYMKELNKLMENKGVVFNESDPGFSIERAANISIEQ